MMLGVGDVMALLLCWLISHWNKYAPARKLDALKPRAAGWEGSRTHSIKKKNRCSYSAEFLIRRGFESMQAGRSIGAK